MRETCRRSARAILLAASLLATSCGPQPVWSARWDDRVCNVWAKDAGGAELHRLEIAPDFERPATGAFLNAFFLPAGDERLLVTQWTAGANTYAVAVYRMQNGRVQEVLDVVTATEEIAMLDVNADGTLDLIVNEREPGGGGMAPSARFVYAWRGDRFFRSALTSFS